jgi:YD repeat-containing protein
MGYSGKFSFNQDRDAASPYGKIIQMPYQDVKIEFTMNSIGIESWVIKTNDGTKFYFGTGNAYEENISTNTYVANFTNYSADLRLPSEESKVYTTSWKLKQIQSSNGDVITFNYDNYTYYNCSYGGESKIIQFSFAEGGPPPHTETYLYSQSKNSKLKEIKSVNGKIVFNTKSNREDKPDSPLLDNIQVFNKDSLLQTINFKTEYFVSEYSTAEHHRWACGGFTPAIDELKKRLKLKEIEFIGNYNTNDLNSKFKYNFEYNTENTLPYRFSFATDYWGYYNGHKENKGAMPSMSIDGSLEIPSINWSSYYKTENKRNIEPLYSKANILERITYPEGGSSKLFYENNAAIIEKNTFEGQGNILQPSDEVKKYLTNSSNNLYDVSFISQFNTNKYTYRKSFTLSNLVQNNGRVEYNSTTNICELEEDSLPLADASCDIKFNIYKLDQNGEIDTSFQFSSYINHSGSINFDAGNYILELQIISTAYDPANFYQSADVNLSWFEQEPEGVNNSNTNSQTHQLFYTGGLRVKEIKEYDYVAENNNNKFLKSRTYAYSQDDAKFTNLPVYYEFVEITEIQRAPNGAYFSKQTIAPRIKSNPVYPVLTTKGSSVGYTSVTETITDNEISLILGAATSNKKVNEYTYNYLAPQQSYFGSPVSRDWRSGNLIESNINKTTNSYVKKKLSHTSFNISHSWLGKSTQGIETNKYKYISIPSFEYTAAPSINLYKFRNIIPKYTLDTGNETLLKEITETKHSEGKITTEQKDFKYEANQLAPTEIKTTVDDDVFITKVFYPTNASSLPGINRSGINKLLIKNKIAVPIQIENYKNGKHIGTQRSNYGSPPSSGEIVVPLSAQTSKISTTSLEDVVVYHDYTPYGQAREVSKKDGTHIYYIWGYNYTYPIAKIENITANEIPSSINELSIQNYTNAQLASFFTTLRSQLPKVQITTYLWEPLVGVIEITDPRAQKQTFEYDAFGRLQYVTDNEGKVLKENKYHYNQN